jgi:hypothetical protein
MAVIGMKAGEVARVRCAGKAYGYSSTKRPTSVPPDAVLEFWVKLAWFEVEKNLHEMSREDKLDYIDARREHGKRMFKEGRYASALRQYARAMTVLDDQNFCRECSLEKKELLPTFLLNQAACKNKQKDYPGVISVVGTLLGGSGEGGGQGAMVACGAVCDDSQRRKGLFLRALAHRCRGDWEEAEADLLECRKLVSAALQSASSGSSSSSSSSPSASSTSSSSSSAAAAAASISLAESKLSESRAAAADEAGSTPESLRQTLARVDAELSVVRVRAAQERKKQFDKMAGFLEKGGADGALYADKPIKGVDKEAEIAAAMQGTSSTTVLGLVMQ